MVDKEILSTIRIGTRTSRLALAQSHWVGAKMEERNSHRMKADYVLINTKGDKLRHLSLAKLDDKGFFTREIESALLNNEVDIAVHSYKDMPTQGPEGLQIAALPWREDPADLLLIRPEAHDPNGEGFPIKREARVGTGSIRRQVLLLDTRPDLRVGDLRGNVNTRVSKVQEGRFDAIVLAAAGVARLGLSLKGLVVHRLDPTQFIPAPGQGVVAVQIRESDSETRGYLEKIHAPDVAFFVKAERHFLALAEGGCNVPLGAWAEETTDGEIRLHTFVGRKGWQAGEPLDVERVTVVGLEPEALAWTAIQILQDRRNGSVWGAESAHADAATPKGAPRILVTASEAVGRGQMGALRAAGFGVVHVPMIETESIVELDLLQEVASGLKDGDWLVFSSSAAVRHFLERLSCVMLPKNLKVAVIGEHTAHSVKAFGLGVDFVPQSASSAGFVADFEPCQSRQNPGRFVLPVALDGRRRIAKALRAQGHEVKVLPVYRTKAANGEAVEAALSIDYEAVVFSSPSGVQGYRGIHGSLPSQCVAIGTTTQSALVEAGVTTVWLAPDPSPASIVRLLQVKLGKLLTEKS